MNVIAFIVSLALFVGGLFIMGESFNVIGAQGVVFFVGIIVTLAGVFVPIHILKRIDA